MAESAPPGDSCRASLESRAVRVVDLDRDMSDVIPTGTTPDSEFLFSRMTDRTLDLARPRKGRRILDVASGVRRYLEWAVGRESGPDRDAGSRNGTS